MDNADVVYQDLNLLAFQQISNVSDLELIKLSGGIGSNGFVGSRLVVFLGLELIIVPVFILKSFY